MRRTGAAMILLLVVSSCADGSSSGTTASPPATVATTGSSTSLPVATTLRPATTTTTLGPATTTTTHGPTTAALPPWELLVDPGMPPVVWNAGSSDSFLVERLCLDWHTEGPATPNIQRVEEVFAANLATLGVVVASEDCDAVLRLSLTGRRSSAVYGVEQRVCWSGTNLARQAVLLVGGEVRRSWPFEEVLPPPQEISLSECAEEHDGIVIDSERAYAWWHEMLFEAVGSRADLATWVYQDGNRGRPAPEDPGCWEAPPDADDVRALQSLLTGDRRRLTVEWLTECLPNDTAARESMLPVVPYLIRFAGGWPVDANPLLEQITGAAFGSPQDWWEWWEGRQD